MTISKKIEDVAIMCIFRDGKLRETRYHIPSGMTGISFLAFKGRNMDRINKLKEGKETNDEIIETTECQQAYALPSQHITLQEFPDDIIVQGS